MTKKHRPSKRELLFAASMTVAAAGATFGPNLLDGSKKAPDVPTAVGNAEAGSTEIGLDRAQTIGKQIDSCVHIVFTEGDTIDAEADMLASGDPNLASRYALILTDQLAMKGITDPTDIPLNTTTEVCQDLRIE